MKDPHFTLLYVAEPARSAAFYADLLGKTPVESSPTFAMFILDSGARLGLWSRATVEPAAAPAGAATELVFQADDDAAMDAAHRDWLRRDLAIAQAPTRMDFGHTFVALDPDGHRLRVYAPSLA